MPGFNRARYAAPAPSPGGGLDQQTQLIISGVIGGVLLLVTLVVAGLNWSWLYGFLTALVVGLGGAGGTFWFLTRDPSANAATPPPPAGGGADPANGKSLHILVGVLMGCFATVFAAICSAVVAAMLTDAGGPRIVAFLAPFVIGGIIGCTALFKHGTK
ncbi:hypothetical protein HYX70_01145 [Candidatus Saccharibacteria bacterium]|nr:hypothetical protein [Candidatus Saccharibacteria bacterium]